jgi:oxygen-dependent protoporphyrinogen oxidase
MHREKSSKRIVVVGAGVTGLTAAWKLRREGHAVSIIERSEHAGGSIRTTRTDGWIVEAGPNTMLVNEQPLLDFFAEIGLEPDLLEASKEANKRYIVRRGTPVAAPMSLGQFLGTPLLSGGAKLRLLCEPFVGRARPGVEESVGDFARRRLGREVVDYAINPLIGGIYAGEPYRLSVRHAFPTLHRFDHDHGSLVLGAIASGRARRKAGKKRFKARSISFTRGLQMIIDALVREVGDSLFNSTEIRAIDRATDGVWRISTQRPDGASRTFEADAVVLAVPARAAAALPFALGGARPLAVLDEIEYPPVTSLALGFRREQIAHPLDGYGMLVPACEGFRILGTLFSSSLFPGRAPEGHVLLTTFVGGMRQPENARLAPDELRTLVLADLARLVGVSGDPVFTATHAWERAIPQYNLGYSRFHDAMSAAERDLPGLIVGGHLRDGVSVGDCIRAGWKLAERAAAG